MGVMKNPALESLTRDLHALGETWAGALPPFGSDAVLSSTQAHLEAMSDDGLVRVTDAVAQVIRDAQAMMSRVGGEVARRSPKEIGNDGLAKKQGFLNAARFVAAATGGALAEASRMVSVGEATAARPSLTGEVLPPKHPHVAAALDAGTLSVEGAALITGMLDRVAPRANPEQANSAERVLVERGADVPNDLLRSMVREAEARLDRDGIKPREDEQRKGRFLNLREDSNGMVCITGKLDPETGAPSPRCCGRSVTNTGLVAAPQNARVRTRDPSSVMTSVRFRRCRPTL
jgi:hypothetical protein